jgi:phage baseplate assembly protein V
MSPNNAPMWRRGLVEGVWVAEGKVKVRLPDEDNMLTDWLPVGQSLTLGARSCRLPRKGMQVVVLLDEHGEDGVVLCGIYSQADPPPGTGELAIYLETEDGTKLSVDPDTQTVTVDTPGHLVAVAGQDARVEAAQITLKGAVTVEGTLAVTEATTLQKTLAVSQDATIGGKSFLNHQHTAQGSTAPTTKPI